MKITFLNKSHIKDILSLSDRILGKGYLTKKHLEEYLNSLNKKAFIVISKDNDPIGYLLFETLTNEEFIKEILHEKEWFKEYITDFTKIAIIKQIAISPAHQKKGVASNLLLYIENKLLNTHDVICCCAWSFSNNTPMKKILLNNQFILIKKLDNYWKKDSENNKYNCAVCGEPPCTCSAMFYLKRLK